MAACHYSSRAPYVAQRVEELSREEPKRGNRTTTTTSKTKRARFAPGVRFDEPAASDWKGAVVPAVKGAAVSDVKASTLLYWFSGTNLTETGMRAQNLSST